VRDNLKRKSILIIDDELLIRDLLYDFFSEKAWEVSVSDSAPEGLEILKNRSFDIALIDLKMPEMDGISFIKKARVLNPKLPLVIMTAFPSFETAVDGLRLKIDDYITKPFNINSLFKTISGIVETKTGDSQPREEVHSD
jgi:DNA-binding response OmpR family regulator